MSCPSPGPCSRPQGNVGISYRDRSPADVEAHRATRKCLYINRLHRVGTISAYIMVDHGRIVIATGKAAKHEFKEPWQRTNTASAVQLLNL